LFHPFNCGPLTTISLSARRIRVHYILLYIYINTYPAMFPRVTSYTHTHTHIYIRSHTFDVGWWRHFYFAFHSRSLTPHPLLPPSSTVYEEEKVGASFVGVCVYWNVCVLYYIITVFLYSSGSSFCQRYFMNIFFSALVRYLDVF